MTGVCRGGDGQLLYTVETDRVGGLLLYNLPDRRERRLFHREHFRVRDLNHHPELPMFACSLPFADGSANLGVIEEHRPHVREITSGDSVDESPSWIPGHAQQLVFQSAGIARNDHGHVKSIGAFGVHQLDLESGELQVVVADPKFDYLLPKQTAGGELYFIRRPYEAGTVRPGLLALIGDVMLFPFRLSRAVVDFLNFFSLTFSKKPLLTAGRRTEGETIGNLMLRGRMIDARRSLRAAAREEVPSLVPKSWQLVRRSSAGDESVIADGVVAYDLAPEQGVVYSNGRGVFELAAGARREVLRHPLIEHLVVVS